MTRRVPDLDESKEIFVIVKIQHVANSFCLPDKGFGEGCLIAPAPFFVQISGHWARGEHLLDFRFRRVF